MNEKTQWFVIIFYDYEGYGVTAYDTEDEARKAFAEEHPYASVTPTAIIKGTIIEGKLE